MSVWLLTFFTMMLSRWDSSSASSDSGSARKLLQASARWLASSQAQACPPRASDWSLEVVTGPANLREKRRVNQERTGNGHDGRCRDLAPA